MAIDTGNHMLHAGRFRSLLTSLVALIVAVATIGVAATKPAYAARPAEPGMRPARLAAVSHPLNPGAKLGPHASLAASAVAAWGDNAMGQLGNGTMTSSTTPVQVRSLSGAVSIAAGLYTGYAAKSDGTVWAWG